MRLLTQTIFYIASILILSNCTGKPTPKKEPIIDASLPVVTLTKNGVFIDMNAIAFEWKSVDNPKVKGIFIYKKSPNKDKSKSKLEYFKTIDSRFSTHFVDKDVIPNTKYSYAFKTFSKVAQSRLSKIINLKSKPVLESVSWIYSKNGMPRTAKIIWRPHVSHGVESYVIERKTLDDKEWEKIAVVDGRLNAEYIDKGLKDNYIYNYRVRVKTYDGLLSKPSATVKIVTKALPKSIKSIKVTKNLPKKIKISWDKSTAKDFAIYNLYRSDEIDGSYELIATLHNPKFVDTINEDAKNYFYRVSVVDKDGLESIHDKLTVHGMTLSKPKAPSVVKANVVGKKIEIVWKENDLRVKSYVVVKKQKKGWFDESIEEFEGIKGRKFIDSHIEPDTLYTYIIYALDKNFIKSEPSLEVTIKTKESNEIIKESKKKPKNSRKKSHKSSSKKTSDVEIISPMSDLDVNES